MNSLISPRDYNSFKLDHGKSRQPHVGFETARVGRGFDIGAQDHKAEMRNTFHTTGNTPASRDTANRYDLRSQVERGAFPK